MRRRRAAGEAGDGEVEAAPEEMDRAGLAVEAGAEALEHRHDPRQRGVQAVGGIGPIFARRDVLGKGDGIGNFVRLAIKVRRQAVRVEHFDQAAVKRGDAAEVERQQVTLAVGDAKHDGVPAQVERQGEVSRRRGNRLDRQPLRHRMKRRVPAMIGPGRMGDPQLAQHLAGQVQQCEGRRIPLDIEGRPIHRHPRTSLRSPPFPCLSRRSFEPKESSTCPSTRSRPASSRKSPPPPTWPRWTRCASPRSASRAR